MFFESLYIAEVGISNGDASQYLLFNACIADYLTINNAFNIKQVCEIHFTTYIVPKCKSKELTKDKSYLI